MCHLQIIFLPPPPVVTQEDQLPSCYSFPCGVLAGVLASVTTQPADVVKTRMQLQPQAYPSVISTIAVVVRNNGLRGLLVGLAPRATRRTLMAAFTWTFYEEVSILWWEGRKQCTNCNMYFLCGCLKHFVILFTIIVPCRLSASSTGDCKATRQDSGNMID